MRGAARYVHHRGPAEKRIQRLPGGGPAPPSPAGEPVGGPGRQPGGPPGRPPPLRRGPGRGGDEPLLLPDDLPAAPGGRAAGGLPGGGGGSGPGGALHQGRGPGPGAGGQSGGLRLSGPTPGGGHRGPAELLCPGQHLPHRRAHRLPHGGPGADLAAGPLRAPAPGPPLPGAPRLPPGHQQHPSPVGFGEAGPAGGGGGHGAVPAGGHPGGLRRVQLYRLPPLRPAAAPTTTTPWPPTSPPSSTA